MLRHHSALVPRRPAPGALALGLTLLALALIGVAAWTLADNQADQRRDLRNRFVDRTAVASSLVDSLFRVAFTSQARDASERLGGPLSAADLDAQARRNQVVYVAVGDPSGRLIAASKNAPPDEGARLAARPFHVRKALRNGFGLGDVRGGVIESAVAFQTAQGPRVLVQGTPVKAFSGFLAGTLRPLPTLKGSEAVVLDGAGHPVGGLTHDRKPPFVPR